ncbi:dipeptide ABC transporter ATP-binding protein [Actinomyces minihominis]|uniref:dipeptide ABC transporter ATP-binding protein n=1 Tax=Actinomyces minihominis TaxID=2002838 RepID=UPI001F5C929A|nr:ABC transporter ATP-binding protein [Actinomyces minihominis]
MFESSALPERGEGVPVLSVRDLKVTFPSEDGPVHAVRGVNFTLRNGEVLGIVGESGSGKSVTSMAIMGLLDEAAKVEGSIEMYGTEILGRSDAYMSQIRGKVLSMVFQDPLSALTPVYTIGTQLVEALQIHQKMSEKDAEARAIELLGLVGIPNPEVRIKAFPHEFSGGMRQRVMIAMAIANDPDLIIADEPTTALDVTIQAQILDLLRTLQRETGAAVIMITHDLGVVAGMADKVSVMYAGKVVESGPVDEVFYRPHMPYTIGLLGALPRPDEKSDSALATLDGNPPSMLKKPTGCPFAPRCPMAVEACLQGEPTLQLLSEPVLAIEEARVEAAGEDRGPDFGLPHRAACIRQDEIAEHGWHYKDIYPIPRHIDRMAGRRSRDERENILELTNVVKTFPLMKGAVFKRQIGSVHAVDGISFRIKAGETMGLVGESGCGKTTTLLEILDLHAPEEGKIVVLGRDTAQIGKSDRKKVRQDLQVVFQDPMASLDPRMPISEILAEPLKYNGYSKTQIQERIAELIELVGLERAHLNRYPRHFSGGQRQRIGIARALALEPKLLVLDEPVSALDVSIQAGVINLLDELKAKLGLSYLFVAHDLSVVRHIADRVAVMYLGVIVEKGDVEEVFRAPQHPYTQALLSAIPIPDPRLERSRERILLSGDLPSPADPPSGCRFRTRCPLFKLLPEDKQQLCIDERPELKPREGSYDMQTACHYPEPLNPFVPDVVHDLDEEAAENR